MNRLQHHFRALGSECLLTVVGNNIEQLRASLRSLEQLVNSFESQFSRFIATSELSMVNKRAGQKTKVTGPFLELLDAALQLHGKTDGLYNPALLPKLQAAGYLGSWPHPENSDASLDYRQRMTTDAQKIIVGPDWVKLPATMALDFGGIGKGYLLDLLGDKLESIGVTNYWLSLGGDILCRGHDVDGEGWQIAVADAYSNVTAGHFSAQKDVRLAVATSGITKRRGHSWHHIIDPSTGKPAVSDLATATVADQSATRADVIATCLIIVGSQKAKAFAKKLEVLGILLQKQPHKESRIA